MHKTVSRADWIAALMEYEGTPFRHQGRVKGVGVDCIGLIACAAKDVGLRARRAVGLNGYARAPDDRLFATRATEFLDPHSFNRLQPMYTQLLPGDVLFFWLEKRDMPRHTAVYLGRGDDGIDVIYHAYARHPRCVTKTKVIGGYWTARIHSAWKVPGIKDA